MTDRLRIALPDIVQAFSKGPAVLTEAALREILRENRKYWRLSNRETQRVFISFMLEKTKLRQFLIDLPRRPIHGYTWGEVPLMESMLQLVPGSYFSHYTAVRLHGLTEQVPKTLYLSREKQRGQDPDKAALRSYSQADIDTSFAKPDRESVNQADMLEEGVRVVLLDAVAHEGAGIMAGKVNLGGERALNLRYTNLERTLIDIAIRPIYAGGIFEVAKAFEHAQGKLSVNAMNALYRKLRPYYPHHQRIGYYLERAGYKPSLIELFRRYPMEHDFYLTHNMDKTVYNERWRLHLPEGF